MATQNQTSPDEFMAIAGDVSREDAEKYLKMGKYNLEMSLNYFFNKKDKSTKQSQEPEKPKNIFQRLQEGGKKQTHYENLVKELTTEPKSKSNKSTTTKAETPLVSASQSQKNSSAKSSGRTTGNKSVSGANKKGAPVMSQDTRTLFNNFFGSVPKEKSQVLGTPVSTVSKEIEEKSIAEESDGRMNIENEGSNNQSISIEKSYTVNFEIQKPMMEELKQVEEQVRVQFPRQCSVDLEPLEYQEVSNSMFLELENSVPDAFPSVAKTTKSFKRSYQKVASMDDASSQLKSFQDRQDENEDAMLIENPSGLEGWSKHLGNMKVKAQVVSSLKVNIKQGEKLEFKLEKSTVPEKKKGPRSKQVSNGPTAIIRILYQNQELGKLDNAYAEILFPLLDQEYISLDILMEDLPSSWSTFATFWVTVKVRLLAKAISKPLTKVNSLEDNLSVEEEILLKQFQHTQGAFTNLFEHLNLNCTIPCLIKKPSPKDSMTQSQATKNNSQMLNESKETTNTSKMETEENKNNEPAPSFEKEVFRSLLSEDRFSFEDIEPSIIFQTLSLDLELDSTKILTWMRLREGCEEKQQDSFQEKQRILHPLWEEYMLEDHSLIYFNPFTGQLCIELPKGAQNCSGGILANSSKVSKVELVSGLVNLNIYDHTNKEDPSSQLKKKKALTFSHGSNSLSNIMKGPLQYAKTLLIVPVDSLYFWERSLNHGANENSRVRVLVYYGQKRSQEIENLGKFDVVLTTYGIISGEFSGDGKKDLYNYDWLRVVLDEAQYIRGKRIHTMKAVNDLHATHRWCLTEMTTNNRLEDLYNMINFLKLEPWSHMGWWTAHVSKPLEKGEQGAMKVLEVILGPVLLNMDELDREQRALTKSQKMGSNKVYKTQFVELSEKEKMFYACLWNKGKSQLEGLPKDEDALLDNYSNLFEAIERVRQACDHPFLIYSRMEVTDSDCVQGQIADFFGATYEDDEDENQRKSFGELSIEDERSLKDRFHDHFEVLMDENTRTEQVIAIQKPNAMVDMEMIHQTVEQLNLGNMVHCPLCLKVLENTTITICGHIMCDICVKRSIEKKSMCPVCSTILTRKDCLVVPRAVGFQFDIREKYKRSSKVEALVSLVEESVAAGKKCVVFSHFHALLLLLEYDLEQSEIEFLKLDVGLHEEERAMRIQQFNADSETFVLLSTMFLSDVKAEKIVADVVLIAEPGFDLAFEEEILQNVNAGELGENVEVVRFVCQGTIEKEIVDLAAKKENGVTSQLLGVTEEKIQKYYEDLCSLLQEKSEGEI